MAICPVTVLKRSSYKEVALLALPVENLLNPCTKAQEVEDMVIDRSDSVASVFYMTMKVTNTPSTMQDSCMCH